MTLHRTRVALFLFLTLTLFTVTDQMPLPARGQATPTVGVWNNLCGSSNVTTTNPSCGPLAVGNEISVQINVTNAPAFNSFEFSLYYDPAFIKATGFDLDTQTVFSGGNPTNLASTPLSPAGTVHLSVTNFANPSSYTGSNGTLANVSFEILAVGVSPLVLAAGIARPSGANFGFTNLINVAGSQTFQIQVDTSDGYFRNDLVRVGPVAMFTYTPSSLRQGDRVTFDASASFDPDGVLTLFKWDFGNGVGETTRFSTIQFIFAQGNAALAGNFSVRLTVVDNATGPPTEPCTTGPCFQGMTVDKVEIEPADFHDVAIDALTVTPNQVNPGENVTVRVVVANNGFFPEMFNLTVSYQQQGGAELGLLGSASLENISVPESQTLSYALDTTGLSPGFYSVIAEVKIARDNRTSNNLGSQTFQVLGESNPSSSPLYLAISVVAVVAALVVLGLFLRRRRKRDTD